MDSLEKQRNYDLAAKLLTQQNFGTAVISGLIAMVLSAGLYGIVKALADNLYYSILAAGIGIAIGLTMQFLGRGIERNFAVAASVLALLGCMLGNMFAIVTKFALANAESPFGVLHNAEVSELYRWMFSELRFADLMFWAIGIGGAAYFSRRPLTREEGLALHTYKLSR